MKSNFVCRTFVFYHDRQTVAVIPDPRATRSLRFSPMARTVDGYHPSIVKQLLTGDARPRFFCQTSKTRVRARLDIRTERLAHTHVASRQGARSASEMQSCWLDKRFFVAVIPDPRAARSLRFSPSEIVSLER